MPGSLNCEAMVPKMGSSSSLACHNPWLRAYCFFTSRRASKAPLLSNLLIATISAKSSISIFSNWVAAPNSGVITYRDTSLCSKISVSDCPMPEVSKIIRSYFAALSTCTASDTCLERAKLDCRVANDRMYTRSLLIAFIRIRSPKSAPPVFRLEGSTETIPICLSGKSIKNLRTNSSTRLDFPAPPVPVIPSTGTLPCSFWMVDSNCSKAS